MNSIKLIVFDCDGVLVDSEAIAVNIESELLTQAGFPLTAQEIGDRFVGLSYASVRAEIEAQFGRRLPESLNRKIQQRVLDTFPEQLQAVPGIDDLLSGLELPRCVASSSNLDRIRFSLRLTSLDRHFEPAHVFSAQMVERGKPEPDLFLHAAQQMDVDPSHCLVLEDSPHGVTAGIRAGMQVVGLIAGSHAGPTLARRLAEAGAHQVIDTPEELVTLLTRP